MESLEVKLWTENTPELPWVRSFQVDTLLLPPRLRLDADWQEDGPIQTRFQDEVSAAKNLHAPLDGGKGVGFIATYI